MARLSKLSRSIKGRVAIVTGAASGMGLATAKLLADEGANVGLADRNAAGLAEAVTEITEAGGNAAAFDVDLADAAAVTALADRVRAEFGPIDIVVNNAGVSAGVEVSDPSFEDVWLSHMKVNLDAQMRLVRACLDDLRRNGEGRVVNIASTEGLAATSYLVPYVASKHGVVGLTRALAVDLGAEGITVNCICPGPIRTGMTAAIPEEHKQKYAGRRVPLKRYGEPEEVAHMTLALVLPAASFVNGAVIPVDGGLSAKSN